MPLHYMTMQDYLTTAHQRFDAKIAQMSRQEKVVYLMQMTRVHEGTQLSGLDQWNGDMTMGAMFMSSSIRSGLVVMHKAGVLDERTTDFMLRMCDEQENIACGIDRASRSVGDGD